MAELLKKINELAKEEESNKIDKKEKIELCYLWIDDYNLIYKQGFNFGSKYIFDYDCENRTIIIKENTNYIDDFFGKNMINITALVGTNGTGKSFLLGNLTLFLFNSNINHIAIFRKGAKIIVIYNIMEKPYIKYENSIKNKIEYYKLTNEPKEYNATMKQIRKELGIINSIFYSNVFYNSSDIAGKDPYQVEANISTVFLIKNTQNIKSLHNLNQVDKLFQYDMLLMLQFLSHKKEKIDKLIKPPIRYLRFQTKNNYIEEDARVKKRFSMFLSNEVFHDYDSLMNDSDKKEMKKFSEIRDDLFDKLCIIAKSNNDRNSFKIDSIMNILYDFYNGANYNNKVKINIGKLKNYKFDYINNFDNKNIDINRLIDDVYNVFNEIIFYLKETKDDLGNFNIKNGISELEKFMSFIKILSKLDDILESQNNIVTLELDKNINIIFEFVQKYYYSSKTIYYTFEWVNELGTDRRILSSGEEAMFKMYARLYSQIKNTYNREIYNIDENYKNVLVLIDEPEAYLHPEWQRKLINYLINYFKEIYNEYNVQLILTSNTPFLISDLLRENIILLEKEEIKDSTKTNYNCKYEIKVKNDLLERSFGQNIHTLLKESFFMNSTIGEYSKNKINQIILALKPFVKEHDNNIMIYPTINQILEKLKLKNINDVEKLIELIGEPIIRKKLMAMLELCILNDSKEMYKRRIQEKINELKEKFEAIDRE